MAVSDHQIVATIPAQILDAVQRDDDLAFVALLDDGESGFAVDWREEDESIVWACESVLQTGRLTAEWVRADLLISFGTKQIRVPLTQSAADRHITLLALNEALAPEFEVRMLYASVGNDTGVFVPLSSADWVALELQAAETVSRRFHKLRASLNTFTDLVKVPEKAKPRHWWKSWAGRLRRRT